MRVDPAMAPKQGTDTKLREATQQFEGLFLNQMLEAMRRTAPKGGILPANSGEQMFRQMFDQEIAQRMAQGGGIGIGEMLYRQFALPETKQGTTEISNVAEDKLHANR